MYELLVAPLSFAALAALSFAPLEALLRHERRAPRLRYRTDLAFATLGQVLTACGTLLLVGVGLSGVDALSYGLWGEASLPGSPALHVALGLVVFELGGYVYHRLAHAVPALWRLHAVHHSSRDMDWLAAFRQHPIEIVLMTAFQNAPLVLLGIPLGSHAVVVALLRLHTVFLHSNVRLPRGPWDWVIALPRFHQRHHQRDRAVANFASLFPWLDRLGGTHCAGEAERFGVAEALPRGFVGLLVHPFRVAATPRVLDGQRAG